jgi:hypothetical protein
VSSSLAWQLFAGVDGCMMGRVPRGEPVFGHWLELCRRDDDVIDIFVARSSIPVLYFVN